MVAAKKEDDDRQGTVCRGERRHSLHTTLSVFDSFGRAHAGECIFFFDSYFSFICAFLFSIVYFKLSVFNKNSTLKSILRECLRAGLPAGFPRPPVRVPAEISMLVVWIPNQK